MIKLIIELLKTDNFYGVNPYIDIAKGKYKAKENYKDLKDHIIREYYGGQ